MSAVPPSLRTDVLRAYRSLLKAANHVFRQDPRMRLGARLHAKEAFIANAAVTDAGKISELIAIAHDARDFMFHELVEVEYDEKKGKHVATLEARHLKDNETGEHVLKPPQ